MSEAVQRRILRAVKRVVIAGALLGSAVTGWRWGAHDFAQAHPSLEQGTR
jgi:hypothetical protein